MEESQKEVQTANEKRTQRAKNEARIGMEKVKGSQRKVPKSERHQATEKKEIYPQMERKRDTKAKRKEDHLQIDIIRDQTEKRRARKLSGERQERDQNTKRKDIHAQIDTKRDKTTERKEMQRKIEMCRDKQRDKCIQKKGSKTGKSNHSLNRKPDKQHIGPSTTKDEMED